jgi:hypothetical protein
VFAGGGDHLLDPRLVLGAHRRPRIEGGHALAHECGRVRHGAHDALGSQPGRDAVGTDPCGDAQLQRVRDVRLRLRRGFLESLRLHRPDDQAGGGERRSGLLVRRDTELLLQPSARFGERFHHRHLRCRKPLLEQAADDGARHVAATDEGNAWVLVVHADSS